MFEICGLQCVVNVARINNIVFTKSAMFNILLFPVMYYILENFIVIVCVVFLCFVLLLVCLFVCNKQFVTKFPKRGKSVVTPIKI